MSQATAFAVHVADARALASRAAHRGRAAMIVHHPSSSGTARRSRLARRGPVTVRAVERADDDGPAIKIDLKLSDVRKGKKIGGGSFGDVFEGTYKGQPVILKERKENKGAQGLRFFQTEAAIGRRLKGAAGAADFIGVAGANAYLVYKDEGRVTLESILGKRDGLKDAMGAKDDAEAVRVFAKQLLSAVNTVHGAGVIHRDVKPDNILFAGGNMFGGGKGKVKLIDLGAAADLRTGVNYSEDETVFDPVYGPPEKYLSGSFGGLLGGLGWAKDKPDLFDAFSCGMVILQVACPSLRKKGSMGGVKRDLNIYGYDAERWRSSLPERRQADFEILDANGGKGWKTVCGLLSQKKGRTSVKAAMGQW